MQKKFYISPIFFKEAKFELNVFKRATQLTLNSPEFNYPAHKYQTRDATRKGAKAKLKFLAEADIHSPSG